nr:hypothetical protein [Nocardioides panaciterrulae]
MQRVLRRAVLDLAGEARRRPPVRVNVGDPTGSRASFVEEPGLDHALRADVLAALVARTRGATRVPLVWLTRSGEAVLQDADAAWLAAARSAYAEAGLPLTLVVVTRQGWWDPRSGTARAWLRPRDRSRHR